MKKICHEWEEPLRYLLFFILAFSLYSLPNFKLALLVFVHLNFLFPVDERGLSIMIGLY